MWSPSGEGEGQGSHHRYMYYRLCNWDWKLDHVRGESLSGVKLVRNVDVTRSEGAWTGLRVAGVDRREMVVRGMDNVGGKQSCC